MRPPPHQIDTAGASDGDGLFYNAATDELEYGPPPSGGDPTTTKGDLFTHNTTVAARQAVGADGTSLVADNAQTTGLKYENRVKSVVAGSNVTVDNTDPLNPVVAASGSPAASMPGIIMPVATTAYAPPYNSAATTTTTLGSGQLIMYPFPVTTTMSIASMSASLSATTGGSGILRLGIYNSNATTLRPSTPFATAGTVTNAATGTRTATFSGSPLSLSAGFYWVAYLVEGVQGTWVAITNTALVPGILGGFCRIAAAGVSSGSLPNPAPTMTPETSAVGGVKIWVNTA